MRHIRWRQLKINNSHVQPTFSHASYQRQPGALYRPHSLYAVTAQFKQLRKGKGFTRCVIEAIIKKQYFHRT